MLGKLKKLKGRTLAEFNERGRQGANIFAERFGVSSQIGLPVNSKFFQRFKLTDKSISELSFFEHFRERKEPKFYASLEDPDSTIAEMKDRFPGEAAAVIERADRICAGLFDLLGYTDLHFEGKIPNWHLDPVAAKTSPKVHWSKIPLENSAETGDNKIIWELNRHQYFSTLGQAYWLTGNEKYAETFVAHLENWVDDNPPKIGMNWLSSLEIAFRSISWIWAFYFFKDSPKFTSKTFVNMSKHMYLNGRHLETYLSTYFSPNTHLTGEALGLYFLAVFLPELNDSERWKKLGYSILLDALDYQIREDGGYVEQSTHYHRYTTDFYTNLLILRQLEGAPIEQKHQDKLTKLFEFLLFFTQPNGETPLFGDEDGGRLYFLDERGPADYRSTLAMGAALFARGDLKFAAKDATPELLWLLGAEGLRKFDEIEAIKPKETSKAFAASGFFTVRDSWKADANFLLIDCGEHGFLNGGHAHADSLSFVLSFNGQPIFVDSGTYKYSSDPQAREMFRSTPAHNCLTVNGESSSVTDGPFSWASAANSKLLEWRDDSDCVHFRGTHDGFERFKVNYEREIVFRNHGEIVINDLIKSEALNLFELNFILSPNIEAEVNQDTVRIFAKNREKQWLLTFSSKMIAKSFEYEGFWKIEKCYISSRYGAKVESRKLVFTIMAEGQFQIRTTFSKAVSGVLGT
ncbi:MAG: alginate lyase family protein [Saprospiraceae bacterium]|nr:alginate lyase family protein [Pyrinomonadaceae bacterium]